MEKWMEDARTRSPGPRDYKHDLKNCIYMAIFALQVDSTDKDRVAGRETMQKALDLLKEVKIERL